jgi:hypothetical protein
VVRVGHATRASLFAPNFHSASPSDPALIPLWSLSWPFRLEVVEATSKLLDFTSRYISLTYISRAEVVIPIERKALH